MQHMERATAWILFLMHSALVCSPFDPTASALLLALWRRGCDPGTGVTAAGGECPPQWQVMQGTTKTHLLHISVARAAAGVSPRLLTLLLAGAAGAFSWALLVPISGTSTLPNESYVQSKAMSSPIIHSCESWKSTDGMPPSSI